jgi:hypothetical protein
MTETKFEFKTPVAFIIFNRPEKTARVFDRIRRIEPSELYIIADGPRPEIPADEAACMETRNVVDEVDWDCTVHRNYAKTNLGCFERIYTGIDWVFETAEQAIILEGDCLPHHSFFRFCERMLQEYQNDERVMDISGSNPLGTWKDNRQDYHFSYTGMLWGWATWESAWSEYDPEMSLWEREEARKRVQDVIADDEIFRYASRVYRRTYEGKKDTWDYQWGFTRHINSGMSVVPSRNLVTNIGYGKDATHTTNSNNPKAGVESRGIEFPVETREVVAVDRKYDRNYHELRRSVWDTYRPLSWLRKLYYVIAQG